MMGLPILFRRLSPFGSVFSSFMSLVVKHEGTSCNLDLKQIIQMSIVPISRVLNPFFGVRTPVEGNMRVLTSILKICFFSTLPQ